MLRQRRWLIIIACALAVAVTPAVWGWTIWRRHDLERHIELAVAALQAQGSLEAVNLALLKIGDRREWQPEQHLLKGGVLLRAGDTLRAMQEFALVPRQGKLRVPLFLMVGEALYLEGQLVDAEETFRIIARERPDEPEAHRWLAKVYHEFGSAGATLTELRHLAQLRPDDFLAFRLMALTFAEDMQDFDEAAENYRKALDRGPPERDRIEILRELAHCLLLKKDYGATLEILKELPDGPLPQVVAAEAHWGLGEIGKAQRLIDQLDRTSADHEGVLLLGAVLAIERGDAKSAVPRLRRLLDQHPQNIVARHQLSLAYQGLGDTAASTAESKMMLELRALQMRHDELCQRAVRQPSDVEAREALAVVCEQLGRNEEATRWRRNAAQSRKALRGALPR